MKTKQAGPDARSRILMKVPEKKCPYRRQTKSGCNLYVPKTSVSGLHDGPPPSGERAIRFAGAVVDGILQACQPEIAIHEI